VKYEAVTHDDVHVITASGDEGDEVMNDDEMVRHKDVSNLDAYDDHNDDSDDDDKVVSIRTCVILLHSVITVLILLMMMRGCMGKGITDVVVPDHDGGRPMEVNACILTTHMVYL
jgi:hypothetical protein